MQRMTVDHSDLLRLILNLIRIGTNAEIDYDTQHVRVKVGDNDTKWRPWTTYRAGDAQTWFPPSVGEQVIVLSPEGEFTNAAILPAIYSDKFKSPSTNPAHHTIRYADGAVVQCGRESPPLRDAAGRHQRHRRSRQSDLERRRHRMHRQSAGAREFDRERRRSLECRHERQSRCRWRSGHHGGSCHPDHDGNDRQWHQFARPQARQSQTGRRRYGRSQMSYMSARNGRALSRLAHIMQSLTDILTTPIGSRVMRRGYGSAVPELIDQPWNGATVLRISEIRDVLAASKLLGHTQQEITKKIYVRVGENVKPTR